MDPLSIIAGVIGIATATAHTARRVKEVLDSIKEGPEVVRSIAKEVGILQCSLAALEDLLRNSDGFSEATRPGEGARCLASLKTILTHCKQNIESIDQTVKPFTEKCHGSKEHRWRTMAGWASRKDNLDSLNRELVSVKVTLDLTITLATFLLTRAGISQLQTQLTELKVNLEQEVSDDGMSDIGSSSVVTTDLKFAIKRFWNEPDTTALPSNPFTTADYERPAKDLIDENFGWRTRTKVNDINFIKNPKNGSRHHRGFSFNSLETFPSRSSPPGSPLSRKATFNFSENSTPASPVTSFTSTFSQTVDRSTRKPDSGCQTTNQSQMQQPTLMHHGRLPKSYLPEQIPPGLHRDDTGWESFQIPMRIFSNYFRLPFKKMMKNSPTSVLNFGIVTTTPISNSPAYADIYADDCGDKAGRSWDQINDSKLYRLDKPQWTLQRPGHKAAGGPPTKGVSQVSLSKVVTNGMSYEFIRLFVVAQKPPNSTSYYSEWKPFCVFTYIGYPRRIRDIGVDESTSNVTKTSPNTTPASAWLAVRGDMLTFRLKSDDDKNFLNPYYAYWCIDSSLDAD